jgi:predicted GIY-YIG superfamily endonuclease
MDAPFFVYILASKPNGTLYVGVTNNLARRMSEHKAKLVPGFTREYQVDQLTNELNFLVQTAPARVRAPDAAQPAVRC